MFWRLRRRLQTRQFDWQIRKILDTPPIRLTEAPWSIVSMTSAEDARMYLLGMKSFYRKIGGGKIIAIVRRDTPAATRRLLAQHLVGMQFVHIEDIDTGACQRGGTWERLCYILDRSRHEYVIQLDSDTLPIGPDLDEVVACIARNRPFTIADDGRRLQSMREAAAEARQTEGDHVVIVAERRFDRYPDCDTLRYVRGSSGFAGFARGGFSRHQLEQFHGRMQRLLGERWTEWGTEQCGSNFAVANSPGAVVLPYPAYASFSPAAMARAEQTKFFHFIGTSRFHGGFFAEQGRRVIASLDSPAATPAVHGVAHDPPASARDEELA